MTTQAIGASGISDVTDGYNALVFVIAQALKALAGPTLVKVISCTANGSVAGIGTVDVQPLVNQVTGGGDGVPHGPLHSLPYFRLQAGGNAVICDPEPGDVGVAVFASRDLSKVIATGAAANPGSARYWDWADGLYLGTVLAANAPTQYMQFFGGAITLAAPAVNVQGNLNVSTGATGSFTTPTGQTVDVTNGIVTNIY